MKSVYSSVFFFLLFNIAASVPFGESGENAAKENPLTRQMRERPDLYQGDILYMKDGTIPQIGANGKINEAYRWPNKTVIWDYDNEFTIEQMETIEAGLALISSQTCIKFKPRSNEEWYTSITNDKQGCFANIGYIGGWYVNQLNLEPNYGCITQSTVAHEMMHTLGVMHEFCRPDRDDYIDIKWENMDPQPGVKDNFAKASSKEYSVYGTPYDFASVMHYGATAGSINGKPVMVAKGNKWQGEFGNEVGPTPSDIKGLNDMYKC